MPDFIHLEELPNNQLKMHLEGNPEKWCELILTGMKKSLEFTTSVIAASKFYAEEKGHDFYEMLKLIDKKVEEMKKKKK